MRWSAVLGMWCLAPAACTPLGFWIYGDPKFQVSLVRVRAEPISDSSVVVALALWNPNDYDISTARFALRLLLDDHTVGWFERDSVVTMSKVDTTTVALPFTPVSGMAPARSRVVRSGGTHSFVVEGEAVFNTPFGERTVRVAEAGAIAFGGPVEAAERDQ